MEVAKIFEFSTFIEKLKKLERFKDQYYWKDYPKLNRYESVADHTWRLGVLVMLFEKKLEKKIDIAKALMITLVHDLPEIIAGDESPMGKDGTGKNTYAYDKNEQNTRFNKEDFAAKSLFSQLDEDLGQELYNLWLEYENQSSFEAKVVKALDKLECLLQVLEYTQGVMFKPHLDFSIDYALKYADVDPSIREYADLIVSNLKKKYKEYN